MVSSRRPITLKDLAARTGVSTTAISHVLNDRLGHVRVSEETKQRVLEAAREMGYVPKLSARSMATQRSYSVGVLCAFTSATIVPSVATYFLNAMRGVEEVCKQANHHCIYASCEMGDPGAFVEPRLMKDGSVDGVILIGHVSTAVARRVKRMGLPCVQVGSNVDPETGIEFVCPDLDGGLGAMVRRLAALGHRKIELFLPSGPGPARHMRHFVDAVGAIAGVRAIATTTPEEWADVDQGYRHGRSWLAAGDAAPTGIICSPIHAEGFIRAMEEAGKAAPRDYSLAVMIPEESGELRLGRGSQRVDAVRFPIRDVGRRAAIQLFDRLEVATPDSEAMGQSALVPCTLHEAETCGAVPRDSSRGVGSQEAE
jgi:LacI family transcriptional regulator